MKQETGGFGAICLVMGLIAFVCVLEHSFLYGKDDTVGANKYSHKYSQG